MLVAFREMGPWNVILNADDFEDAKKRVFNASVRLSGSKKKIGDEKATGFLGSGVILRTSEEEGKKVTEVLTAKHNFYIWAGHDDPPDTLDRSDLAAFEAALKIKYAKSVQGKRGDMTYDAKPAFDAAIDAAVPFYLAGQSDTDNPFNYDLLILRSSDENLFTYAQGITMDQAKIDELVKSYKGMLKKFSFLTDKYDFFQVGFGETKDEDDAIGQDGKPTGEKVEAPQLQVNDKDRESNGGTTQQLQFRMTVPKVACTGTVFNQTATPDVWHSFEHVTQLGASVRSCTGPGDSGGPLFAVEKPGEGAAPKVYLLGVTTGGYMSEGRQLIEPFTNAISTTLLPYYQSLSQGD